MPANAPLAAAVALSGRRPALRGVLGRTAVLAVAATLLLASGTAAQTYEVLKAFSTGWYPYGGLIQGTDGYLYGTAADGGASGLGTVFKIDTNGSTLTTLHSFAGSDGASPLAGLIEGTDGYLYGTAYYGGASGYPGYGTIFKIDTSGATFTTLHSFEGSDGANPYAGLIQGTDGNLYGTTYQGGAGNFGAIFKIDTNDTTFTTLHSFAYTDGAYPYGGLIQGTDGHLYGTTYTGSGANAYGTVFRIDTTGSTFTTLHSFTGSDGEAPYAGLIQGTDGYLYGTTYAGGANGAGTIFKTDANGTFTSLHSLTGSDGFFLYAGLVQGADGYLYGTTFLGDGSGPGTIFRVGTNGSTFTTLHSFAGSDGAYPYTSLIQGTDGYLYGTTAQGGTSNSGTIFKISTDGSAFTSLHSFDPRSDGANPYGSLIQGTDGYLYGTTHQGGAHEAGTIFKTDTNGTTFTTLHSFAYSDGATPYASLIQGADGYLYGTTTSGDVNNPYGTIFKIDPNGSTFTTLHSFAYSDGASPYGGLIQGTDGHLYGTTTYGGANNYYGTIFKIDTNGTGFATLHSFAGSDGAYPYGDLIQGAGGYLYGTTNQGGTQGYGTIFKIDTNGSMLTTLHSFAGSDGGLPYGGLIQATDANLYGTTSYAGGGGYGTIFKIDTNGAVLTTLHSFAYSDGASPYGELIQGSDGSLYGTTYQSSATGYGTIFQIDVNGSTLTTLHGLTYNDGAYPYAGLIQGTDGNLYGTASAGGPDGGGVVFRIAPGCFYDVPPTDPFFTFICTVARDGITAGCGGGNYCPDNPVTRAQMAVFLLRAEHGSTYTPPACTAPGIFGDVPCPGGFAVDWIEQLHNEGITGGCSASPLLYCPNDAVTRAQMAVFLLRAEHGSGYAPPACHGVFTDVPCPGGFAVDWIEQLAAEGITGGCGSGNYCPNNPNTRGQMAVFLVTTFKLP